MSTTLVEFMDSVQLAKSYGTALKVNNDRIYLKESSQRQCYGSALCLTISNSTSLYKH